MSDAERALQQYHLEVVKADAERLQQAGWLALCELKPEINKCVSFDDVCRWVERVNERAEQILRRLN